MSRYHDRKANGLCVVCGDPAEPNYVMCLKHIESARDRMRQRNGADRDRDPEGFRLRNRKRAIARKYGITVERYEEMVRLQDGRCAICGGPPKERNVGGGKGETITTGVFDIDHDHETGEVRQLLCHECNRLLGFAKDDPQILRAAADYVDRHRKPAPFVFPT